MSQAQLAKRIDIVGQSLGDLESDEVRETITLFSLRNAADALGYDLQYGLVLRKPLEKMIPEKALKKAAISLRASINPKPWKRLRSTQSRCPELLPISLKRST